MSIVSPKWDHSRFDTVVLCRASCFIEPRYNRPRLELGIDFLAVTASIQLWWNYKPLIVLQNSGGISTVTYVGGSRRKLRNVLLLRGIAWSLRCIAWSSRGIVWSSRAIAWGSHNTLLWRHNERDSVSSHQRLYCLLKRLFRRRSKVTSKLRVTGLCAWNSPGTGEFPAQKASNAENVSILWRHHESDGSCNKWWIAKSLFASFSNIHSLL